MYSHTSVNVCFLTHCAALKVSRCIGHVYSRLALQPNQVRLKLVVEENIGRTYGLILTVGCLVLLSAGREVINDSLNGLLCPSVILCATCPYEKVHSYFDGGVAKC